MRDQARRQGHVRLRQVEHRQREVRRQEPQAARRRRDSPQGPTPTSPSRSVGHTDSKGSDKADKKLSQRRVESVREYLVEQGHRRGPHATKGYGEYVPVDTNLTKKAAKQPPGRVHPDRQPRVQAVSGSAFACSGHGDPPVPPAGPHDDHWVRRPRSSSPHPASNGWSVQGSPWTAPPLRSLLVVRSLSAPPRRCAGACRSWPC